MVSWFLLVACRFVANTSGTCSFLRKLVICVTSLKKDFIEPNYYIWMNLKLGMTSCSSQSNILNQQTSS